MKKQAESSVSPSCLEKNGEILCATNKRKKNRGSTVPVSTGARVPFNYLDPKTFFAVPPSIPDAADTDDSTDNAQSNAPDLEAIKRLELEERAREEKKKRALHDAELERRREERKKKKEREQELQKQQAEEAYKQRVLEVFEARKTDDAINNDDEIKADLDNAAIKDLTRSMTEADKDIADFSDPDVAAFARKLLGNDAVKSTSSARTDTSLLFGAPINTESASNHHLRPEYGEGIYRNREGKRRSFHITKMKTGIRPVLTLEGFRPPRLLSDFEDGSFQKELLKPALDIVNTLSSARVETKNGDEVDRIIALVEDVLAKAKKYRDQFRG